jgi:hypothetical protein
MKTPRLTDFDPNAKIPTLKSSLDNMPSIQKQKPPIDYTQPRQNISTITPHSEQPARKVFTQPAPQSHKRSYIRRTFDFYEDQIAYLTRQSLQERLAGNERSMNEMVREALDDWIKKRTSKE